MTATSALVSASADPADLPPCLCGGTEYRQVRAPARFLGTGPVFEVRACVRCGLARTAPPPYDDELTAEIYQELPYEAVTSREPRWRRV